MALLLTEFQLWGKRGNESHAWPMFRMISLKSCFSEESVFDEAEGGKRGFRVMVVLCELSDAQSQCRG